MLSTGVPNASGTVNFYTPGTLTPANVFSDPAGTIVATQPITLDNGGRIPVASFANGIYTTVPVRVIVKDVNGNTVSDATLVPTAAGAVGVSNADWPNESTVDGVLTALGTSLGSVSNPGLDGKYLYGSGATLRPIHDKFSEAFISVKDFGAAGDGITDDTAALQAAVNAIKAAGSGKLRIPAGNYKISSTAISLASSSTGITIEGDGSSASTITQSTASTDSFDASGTTGLILRGIGFAGGGVTLTNPSATLIDSCSLGTPSGVGLTLSGGTRTTLRDCTIGGSTISVAAAASTALSITGGRLTAAIGVKFSGASGQFYASNVEFDGGTGAQWAAGTTVNGLPFTFVDCPTLGGITAFDASALSVDPGIVQRNCGLDAHVDNITTGGPTNYTLPSYYGQVTLNANTNGAGGTVVVSAPTPVAGVLQSGKVIICHFVNGTGSAVTWSLNGVFATTTSIDGTDTHKTSVGFYYDSANAKWREMWRAQTT